MELKEYIRIELEGLERGIDRVTNGLTQQELAWRPSSGCNSIGLIFFHMARAEDSLIHTRIQSKPEIWKTSNWFQKLNLAENEAGAHYTIEQVNAFSVPERKDLFAYFNDVHAKTREYLASIPASTLDKKITMRSGEVTVAAVFSILIGHLSQHIGEMSYLRGLQRGMDK